ncbi:hypothetical protein CI610_01369 [invertebrate metagenome]|uniref:Uncharacterized protein n=1 Tax=invertebrate metagenome TaxID=1711999 RepID=A0A2H9T8S6_9ZZZZ
MITIIICIVIIPFSHSTSEGDTPPSPPSHIFIGLHKKNLIFSKPHKELN